MLDQNWFILFSWFHNTKESPKVFYRQIDIDIYIYQIYM